MLQFIVSLNIPQISEYVKEQLVVLFLKFEDKKVNKKPILSLMSIFGAPNDLVQQFKKEKEELNKEKEKEKYSEK